MPTKTVYYVLVLRKQLDYDYGKNPEKEHLGTFDTVEEANEAAIELLNDEGHSDIDDLEASGDLHFDANDGLLFMNGWVGDDWPIKIIIYRQTRNIPKAAADPPPPPPQDKKDNKEDEVDVDINLDGVKLEEAVMYKVTLRDYGNGKDKGKKNVREIGEAPIRTEKYYFRSKSAAIKLIVEKNGVQQTVFDGKNLRQEMSVVAFVEGKGWQQATIKEKPIKVVEQDSEKFTDGAKVVHRIKAISFQDATEKKKKATATKAKKGQEEVKEAKQPKKSKQPKESESKEPKKAKPKAPAKEAAPKKAAASKKAETKVPSKRKVAAADEGADAEKDAEVIVPKAKTAKKATAKATAKEQAPAEAEPQNVRRSGRRTRATEVVVMDTD